LAAVIWSVFGTGALALIGIRLPGIEFFNQRVEAHIARSSCSAKTIRRAPIHPPPERAVPRDSP